MTPPSTENDSVKARSVPSLLRRTLRQRFGRNSAPHSDDERRIIVARAPGRVNLLGGHTDYNDGFVLPTTIDRSVHVALRERDDDTVLLHSVNFDEEVEYSLGGAETAELPSWARYVVGIAAELKRRGAALQGFEAVLSGNVPLGAGLSSSAALEVAVAAGLKELFSIEIDSVETATLCQHVEQEYIGVDCGIMDQFSSRIGQAGHALFLDCRSLDYQHLPLPMDEVCLVVADSGVRRKLASSKYNERRKECEEAARIFQHHVNSEIRSLRDVSAEMLEEGVPQLSQTLFRRARHVVTENQRVEQGADLLAQGKLEAFGTLMSASHASLKSDYEVSCAELDCLAETATNTKGALGARMTGAGFGGCTVTLVRREALSRLKQALTTRYQERFDHDLDIYVVEHNLETDLL